MGCGCSGVVGFPSSIVAAPTSLCLVSRWWQTYLLCVVSWRCSFPSQSGFKGVCRLERRGFSENLHCVFLHRRVAVGGLVISQCFLISALLFLFRTPTMVFHHTHPDPPDICSLFQSVPPSLALGSPPSPFSSHVTLISCAFRCCIVVVGISVFGLVTHAASVEDLVIEETELTKGGRSDPRPSATGPTRLRN